MRARIAGFLRFWYDFVIGDDWRVAVAVVAALALTYVLSATGIAVWWILPVAVALVLPLSLVAAVRGGTHSTRSQDPPD